MEKFPILSCTVTLEDENCVIYPSIFNNDDDDDDPEGLDDLGYDKIRICKLNFLNSNQKKDTTIVINPNVNYNNETSVRLEIIDSVTNEVKPAKGVFTLYYIQLKKRDWKIYRLMK